MFNRAQLSIMRICALIMCGAYVFTTYCLWESLKKRLSFAREPYSTEAAAQHSSSDQTPPEQLFAAALASDKESFASLQTLVAQGANLNAQDINGRTALHFIAANLDPDKKELAIAAEFLLKHNALEDIPDKYGRTPLMMAAQNGHTELAKLLLSYGANINRQDNDGLTPLALAVGNEHAATVEALLAAGANPFIHDKRGWNAIKRAQRIDSESVIQAIEKARDEWETRGRALIDAVKENNLEDVKELLRRRTYIDTQDEIQRTPLYYAYNKNLLPMLELLLQAGANLSLLYNGTSLLHLAAGYGQSDIMKILMQYTKNLNILNTHGNTPLHDAVRHRKFEAIKQLVEAGADILQANNLGHTPYDLAELERLHSYFPSQTLTQISAFLKEVEDKQKAEQNNQAELQTSLIQLQTQLTTLAAK